jgi:hypothetical protein
MIELFIYSDSQEVRDLFGSISRSKHYATTFLCREQLGEATACSADGALIYLDLGSYSQSIARREIGKLVAQGCAWAVIDPDGIIEDPAELFHMGACDYLPPAQLQKRVKAARIHRVADFQKEFRPPETVGGEDGERLSREGRLIPSGSDWTQVKKGQEYTFFFLFIELLPGEEWKVKSGDRNRQDIQSRFEQFVRRRVAALQGDIWMWSEWGGVVLFPFSGNDSNLVLLAIRMMLNRPLISIEEMQVESLVDYKVALHVGNTIYNPRGDTGTIISEDINFLFHLGRKRTDPNALVVTESAYPQIPLGMRPLFTAEDSFEGWSIYRMRRFVF